ncbi:hypothetical protein ACERK3_07325 [Phycisphaerales bacterium AB-hyl4]|uniref:Uncharacterized protein n=1 Tax=Natronomicrosphaera hydrolytica TaxID=3242702 RepID=A0ABV4U5H5_9BACT
MHCEAGSVSFMLDASLCVEAIKLALAMDASVIFDSDQGRQPVHQWPRQAFGGLTSAEIRAWRRRHGRFSE